MNLPYNITLCESNNMLNSIYYVYRFIIIIEEKNNYSILIEMITYDRFYENKKARNQRELPRQSRTMHICTLPRQFAYGHCARYPDKGISSIICRCVPPMPRITRT